MMIPVLTTKSKNDTIDLDNVNENIISREDYQTQAVEYLDQLQRLKAEFSNYKKRIEKERETLFSLAKGELVLKMLPALDDFERMINHHEGDERCSLDGVKLIYQKLKKILSDEGLEEIPSIGEQFDPDFHDAVGVEKTDSKKAGLVVAEWQKGYQFRERVLRPSRVKVGKYDEKAGDS